MSIKLEVLESKNSHLFFESTLNHGFRTRFGVEKALWKSGKDIHSNFNKQVLSKEKSGRIYFRKTASGARRRHRASAPGETPANRTGAYRKGFDFTVAGHHSLTVGDTVDYALYLETGTSRMAPRPGLRNAIDASERDILRNLSGEIEAAI